MNGFTGWDLFGMIGFVILIHMVGSWFATGPAVRVEWLDESGN